MQGLSKFLNGIIIFGCVALGYIFFVAKNDNSQQQPLVHRSLSSSQDPQALANKYLQQAQQNLMADKLRAEINIKKVLQDSREANVQPRVVETDPSKVSPEQQIWKDPNLEKPFDLRFSEQAAQPTKNAELDKQEYIRQFKENARKNGYEITVNDELEVTSVTPIRKPQNSKNDYDSIQNSDSE